MEKSTEELYFWYIMGLNSKFQIQHVVAFIILMLYYLTFLFHLLLFRSPRGKLYNLKSLIRFKLQPAFYHHYNILNGKVSQLKGFPTEMYFLNKVDIYPQHFIFTGVKLFSLGKGLK